MIKLNKTSEPRITNGGGGYPNLNNTKFYGGDSLWNL